MAVIFRVLSLIAVFAWTILSSAAFNVVRNTEFGTKRRIVSNLSTHSAVTSSDDATATTTTPIDESLSASILKKDLLSLIPRRPFGGPATNLTTPEETCLEIERIASNLELLTPLPPLASSSQALNALDGDWQLLYSDASEITRIAKLPMGFRLGPVYQPIDVTGGRFENQAMIKHKFLLFSGHTRVVADFFLADLGETNRAGVVNTGERANVKFQKVIFSLRRLLLLPTFGKIRKTAFPNGPAEKQGVLPSIDVTYLDGTMRIARGGDGSLFILTRPGGRRPMPMLSKETAQDIVVNPESPTYDASVDILPSGSRDS